MASNSKVRIFGDPVLREKSTPVKTVDSSIRQLVKQMLAVMKEYRGVGLAAEQVGRTECLCVIDIPDMRDPDGRPLPDAPDIPMPVVMINPRIVTFSGEVVDQEGCLSFPEIFVNIRRAEEVVVAFTDLEGNQQTVTAHGLFARAAQHEIDHLNGILLVDRMSAMQKLALTTKLRNLKKTAKTSGR